jgi:hypothetical protein
VQRQVQVPMRGFFTAFRMTAWVGWKVWVRWGGVMRLGWGGLGLAAFVVEEEFLFAGDGLAVAGGGGEVPLLDGGDDGLVDGGA